MDNHFLTHTFIFLMAACIVVPLSSHFKLGSVLGYLIAGVLIGPFGFNLIGNGSEIMHYAEFGVVMMLFLIGLELEPAMLWRLRRLIIGLGGLQVLVTSIVLMTVGVLCGFNWHLSLAVGLTLSLSSTAIVLQILQEKELLKTSVGQYAFATLLFQDIAVIPILIIIPLLEITHKVVNPVMPMWQQGLLLILVISVLILAGRYGSHYLFRFMAKTRLREIFTATSLVLVVGIALIMELIGLTPALGAFVAGVVLATSEYKRTIESDIEPFKSLLLGLFFISIGMSMNFAVFTQAPVNILLAVSIILLTKITILYLLSSTFKLLKPHNLGYAIALSQGGEFAFVLLLYLRQLEMLTPAQQQFLTLAVAFSMAATPILLSIFQRFILPLYISELPNNNYDDIKDDSSSIIIAGYGRVGQIVGRFLRLQGIPLTILEIDADQIELIRRFGNKVYFGDASRIDLLTNAGAARAKLLVIAIDDNDKAVEIAKQARKAFPNLKILARARNRRHAYALHAAGVDYSRRETFDSSIKIAGAAMLALGYDKKVVAMKAKTFMQFDEKSLADSFDFFEHEEELINFVKKTSTELEQILKHDNSNKKDRSSRKRR